MKEYQVHSPSTPAAETPGMLDQLVPAQMVSSPEIVTYLEKAAVDVQVATAKAYPRDRNKAMQAVVAEALMDSESMIYTLRYKDNETGETKIVKGPSIRLAEIMMQHWGNIRVWATIVENRPEYVRARGAAWDVQTNAWGNEEVIVPTINKRGQPFPDRLRIIYQQVAISKALRNALLRIIPRSVVNTVMTAIERQQPVTAKAVAGIREWLKRIGVSEATAARVVGANSLNELTPQQLSTLRGIYAAIRDGEITVQDAFREDDGPGRGEDEENAGSQPVENVGGGAQPAVTIQPPQEQQPSAVAAKKPALPRGMKPASPSEASKAASEAQEPPIHERFIAMLEANGIKRNEIVNLLGTAFGWAADPKEWPKDALTNMLNNPQGTVTAIRQTIKDMSASVASMRAKESADGANKAGPASASTAPPPPAENPKEAAERLFDDLFGQ